MSETNIEPEIDIEINESFTGTSSETISEKGLSPIPSSSTPQRHVSPVPIQER